MNINSIKPYGIELILDLHECETPFTRHTITQFMIKLCDLIKMERADLHFWDYETQEEKDEVPDHLAGTSAVQFISTSNVTIHALDRLKTVYLNIFTCSTLGRGITERFCEKYWRGKIDNSILVNRQ